MSKRRHRQPFDATPPRGPSPEVPGPEPPLPRELVKQFLCGSFGDSEVRESGSPTQADIADALDAEIDTMWGLIAALQTVCNECGNNPFAKGTLRLAHAHLDALAAIRRDVDRF